VAHFSGIGGLGTGRARWDAWIRECGCGVPDGIWLELACDTEDEAMDAADRHVVAFVDGGCVAPPQAKPSPPPRPRRKVWRRAANRPG
jgi:hypothetical protein